jgi:predicted nucleic acid-binding protein
MSRLDDLLGGTALINPTLEDYRDAITKMSTLADQPITIFDAVVAVLATRLEMEVWTYDHHFDIMRTSV